MSLSLLFADIVALALAAAGDLVNILAGGLVFLAVVNALVSIAQPLRR